MDLLLIFSFINNLLKIHQIVSIIYNLQKINRSSATDRNDQIIIKVTFDLIFQTQNSLSKCIIIIVEMTSKFFAAGNQSSDSDASEESVKINQNLRKTKNVARGLESSDSEDDKRKVVGEKEKKWTNIKKLCQRIKEKLKINDFSEVSSVYQQLTKEIDRAKNVIDKEGYPSFYMKTILILIETVTNFEGKKELNAINSREYTKLKQKLKKYEKDFEADIQKFKNTKFQQPEEGKDQDEKKQKKERRQKKKSSMNEQDLDSGSEDEVSEKQSDSESDEDDKSPLDSTDPMVRRTYWMKKKPTNEKEKKEKLQKARVQQGKEKQEQKKKLKQKKLQADAKGKKFKLFESKQRSAKFTSQQAKNTLKNALKQIGKPIDDQNRQWILGDIQKIKETLTSDSELISSLVVETLFIIESSRAMTKFAFRRSDWQLIYNNINRMHRIISKSNDSNLLASIESFQKEQEFYNPELLLRSLVSFVNTLNEELRKALVFTQVSEIEYYQRLQDLQKLNELTYKLLKMYEERCDDPFSLSSLASQLIENTYFITPKTFDKLLNQYKSQNQDAPSYLEIRNPEVFLRISKLALKQSDKQNKAKIILYMVYNHAIFGRSEGKTLLLTANIVDSIQNYSFYVQALFNRTLVQLGVNAFIDGNLYEVQHALSDLCSTMRTKQLLAQGFMKQQQQVLQRKRMLPYYLHINVDMIESIELIASMLNQIPYTFKDGGRITSKTFKKIYEPFEKSHYIAQPLNSKDIIYAAAKELQKANWKQCYERLLQLEFWRLITNPDLAKGNILRRIKEQALKCYLLANQASFSVLKISNLQSKFEIQSIRDVHTIINRLIYNGDLNAAATLDGNIKFYHVEMNKMDKIVQELYEKASELVSVNQKNLKQRLGTRDIIPDDDETAIKNKRRGVGSERNKLLAVKKVVVKQRKN